jgi:hypothetical protein
MKWPAAVSGALSYRRKQTTAQQTAWLFGSVSAIAETSCLQESTGSSQDTPRRADACRQNAQAKPRQNGGKTMPNGKRSFDRYTYTCFLREAGVFLCNTRPTQNSNKTLGF